MTRLQTRPCPEPFCEHRWCCRHEDLGRCELQARSQAGEFSRSETGPEVGLDQTVLTLAEQAACKHPQQGRRRRPQSARPVPVRPARRVVHRFLDHVLRHDRQRGGLGQHVGEMRFAGAGRPVDQYQYRRPPCCCCRIDRGHGHTSVGAGPRQLNGACAAGGARREARLEGFEPPTPGSEDQCSNPLSYRRMRARVTQDSVAARRLQATAAASRRFARGFLWIAGLEPCGRFGILHRLPIQ